MGNVGSRQHLRLLGRSAAVDPMNRSALECRGVELAVAGALSFEDCVTCRTCVEMG